MPWREGWFLMFFFLARSGHHHAILSFDFSLEIAASFPMALMRNSQLSFCPWDSLIPRSYQFLLFPQHWGQGPFTRLGSLGLFCFPAHPQPEQTYKFDGKNSFLATVFEGQFSLQKDVQKLYEKKDFWGTSVTTIGCLASRVCGFSMRAPPRPSYEKSNRFIVYKV